MLGLLQLSLPDMPVTQEPLLSSSCLQQGYHNAPHGAHRTGEFPRIRLLNDRVFVTDTFDTAGVSFIMTMAVQQEFVAEFFASSLTFGRHVVDFNDLNVLKEQSTPATFPLLLVQEDTFDPIAQRVVFQSLAPIEEITIVETGCALHFDVFFGRGPGYVSTA